MNFQDAENSYQLLSRQLAARQITPQEFSARVIKLRVRDHRGTWWQIRETDGAWLRWDGRAWTPALPPHRVQPPAGPAPGPAPQQAAQPVASAPAGLAASSIPAQKMPEPPQTLAQFFVLVLKGILKGWFFKIPLAIGAALFALVLHTVLLIGPNGGFAPGTNGLLDNILALQGRIATGSLFWMLLTLLVSLGLARLIRPGPVKLIQKLISTPGWIALSLKQSGLAGASLLLGMGALTILIGVIQGNRLNNLLLAFLVTGSVIAQRESLVGVVARLAWSDARRLFNLRRWPSFEFAWVGAGLTGAALGFFGATILPFAPYCGCASAVLLLGVMVALILVRKGRPSLATTVFLLALLTVLAFSAAPAFADDGGWEESGGTLLGWLRSQGALIAVAMGLPPALGAAIAVLLGSSVNAILPAGLIDRWVSQGLPAHQLEGLRTRLKDLIAEKIKEGYYVRNPGLFSKIWNNTIGRVVNEWGRGYKGGQCGEFGEWGMQWSRDIVHDIYGKHAIVTDITCFRNSMINHRATKVILPNGDRAVLDFWEGVHAGEPRIYSESEWIARYKEKLGGTPEIHRTEHEIFLEQMIREHGKAEGYDRFRRSYSKNPEQGEMLIRSFEKDPWFDPNPPAPPTPPVRRRPPEPLVLPPESMSDQLHDKFHPGTPRPEK